MEDQEKVSSASPTLHSGKSLLEITRDFYASSPRELPVSKGEIVKYICRDRAWIRAKTSDGFIGYIPLKCCRPYDAKRIRQRRKQTYMGITNTTDMRVKDLPDSKFHGTSKRGTSNQLQNFINTAVCEALNKMSVDSQKERFNDDSFNEMDEPDSPKSMAVGAAKENNSVAFTKHNRGVCGRSCRMCYGPNGLRKSIPHPSSFDGRTENSKVDSRSSGAFYTGVDEYPPDEVSVEVEEPYITRDLDGLSRHSDNENNGFTLDRQKDDTSDSGIYVTQTDECNCSRCNSEMDNCDKWGEAYHDDQMQSRFRSPFQSRFSTQVPRWRPREPRVSTASPNALANEIQGNCECNRSTKSTTTLLVLRNFEKDEEEDLTVSKGEIVTLINDSDRDWIWVRNEEGHEGYIPTAYVTDDSCKECQGLLRELLLSKRNKPPCKNEDLETPQESPVSDSSHSSSSTGVRFYVLNDHVGTNGNTLSVKVGDVVIANMRDQLIDGWLWIYCPDKRMSGYLPESILLEADPIEITDV